MSNLYRQADAAGIRAIQAFVYRLFQEGRIQVPIHFAFGHERAASAITSIVDNPKLLFLPHRNIHIQLACCLSRDIQICSTLLEQYLDAVTLSTERDRSGAVGAMNFVFRGQEGYTSSVLGNQLGVAIGASLASQGRQPAGKRTVVVLGDGAIEEGRFWESLIFIKTHELPIDLVIENNGWSMQSSTDQRRCSINLRGIADSFGLHYAAGEKDPLSSRDCGSPRIIEFIIETLGSTRIVESQTGTERIINYHSGPLLDGIERRHYSEFFGMGPLDILTLDSIATDFHDQFEALISPLAKKYGVEGFI